MTQIRFYLDENMDNEVARGLRLRAIDVLTTHEAGNLSLADSEQLEFATSQQRVIVTQDADFVRLHAAGIEHAGIAYYKSQTRSVKEVISSLTLIYQILAAEEMTNRVEFL